MKYLAPFILLVGLTNVSWSQESTKITLTAVGDMMLGTNFPSNAYLPSPKTRLLDSMKPYFQNQDIVFGNLEGTLLNEGGNLKKCDDSTKCYAFRQPEYFADQIQEAGFNLLSIANNHMGDFGEKGRSNTVKVLKEKGFHYAGLERCPWDTMTVKGKIIGFIAFAPNTECLQIEDIANAKRRVEALDSIADIIIVSFHGGAEGSKHTHVTKKTEYFYGENRGNVYAFAHAVIDAGADVVLGHGPHVSRAVDYYKGRFITYSMGNFCTYARFNLRGPNGVAPMYQIELDEDGAFVQAKLVSTKQL
ncbi:MAG: CapA family protein, partial [Crocinitomicaceae bacterium]|nr:CapA family protein [Crocinitomicaceae bacterium]